MPKETAFTDKLYTGQREITGLGIYHYGARFYSPKLGRFLSADTIVPGYANPQNLNRYAYVTNNPLRYIDPTGHMRNENEYGGGCSTSGFCGSSTNTTSTVVTNPDDDDDNDDGGSDYCSTHLGACGNPPTIPDPPTILTPTPAEGGANDYYCLSHQYACGVGTSMSTSDESPNPSVGALVAIGVLLTAAIVVTEIALLSYI